MGLVLTVEKNIVVALNDKVFIQFHECNRKKTELSVLDAENLTEVEYIMDDLNTYNVMVNGKEVIFNLTNKAKGKNKTSIKVEADNDIVISRVSLDDIPVLDYQYMSSKKYNKKKPKLQDSISEPEVIEADILKERYKNELSWFYNL